MELCTYAARTSSQLTFWKGALCSNLGEAKTMETKYMWFCVVFRDQCANVWNFLPAVCCGTPESSPVSVAGLPQGFVSWSFSSHTSGTQLVVSLGTDPAPMQSSWAGLA